MLTTSTPQLFSSLSRCLFEFPVFRILKMASKFPRRCKALLPILLILIPAAQTASTYNIDTTLSGSSFFGGFDFYTVSTPPMTPSASLKAYFRMLNLGSGRGPPLMASSSIFSFFPRHTRTCTDSCQFRQWLRCCHSWPRRPRCGLQFIFGS